jgi:glycosyltransferase involved in cell wall biosynthesis
MRVLVVHNRYQSAMPSGENLVVEEEIDALRGAGVEVFPYLRSSDEIAGMTPLGKASLAVRPTLSPGDVRAVRAIIREQDVDIMHVHNLTPLISPAVVRSAKQLGVPVVQTVHNHRHVCVKGTFFRDGESCHECLGKRVPLPAVRHGCYRDSRLQSVPMALSLAVHHGTWRGLDRYLALTPELADYLATAGVPANRVVVRPNTVLDPGPAQQAGAGFAFVGRLDEGKGVELLLAAWERHAEGSLGPLRVVGEGPLLPMVQDAAERRRDIRITGQLDRAGVIRAMSEAAVVVIPSVVPDVFPRVVLEALALGRPALATRVGGLPGIVAPEAGWVVDAEPLALAAALVEAARGAPAKGAGARRRYVERYSPEAVLQQLLAVYDDCVRRA